MKLFVWDLHGTLEQGNEYAVVEISNKILQDFGYRQRFTDDHVSQLYGLKWHEYFSFLLPEESPERHIELQAACFLYSNGAEGTAIIAKHMRPSRNSLEVLEAIARSHEQVVISNTTPASLPIFLNALGMQGYFGQGRAIAVNQHVRDAKHTKYEALVDYLQDRTPDDIIVVGDSATDIELARQAGAKAYLYAHKGAQFRGGQDVGDYQIRDLAELLREL